MDTGDQIDKDIDEAYGKYEATIVGALVKQGVTLELIHSNLDKFISKQDFTAGYLACKMDTMRKEMMERSNGVH